MIISKERIDLERQSIQAPVIWNQVLIDKLFLENDQAAYDMFGVLTDRIWEYEKQKVKDLIERLEYYLHQDKP